MKRALLSSIGNGSFVLIDRAHPRELPSIVRKGRDCEEARRLYFDRVAGCDLCDYAVDGVVDSGFEQGSGSGLNLSSSKSSE